MTKSKPSLNQLSLFNLPPEPQPKDIPKNKIINLPIKQQEVRQQTNYKQVVLTELERIETAIKNNISVIWDINVNTGKDFYHAITELKNFIAEYCAEEEKTAGAIKLTCKGEMIQKSLYSLFSSFIRLYYDRKITKVELFKSKFKYYPELNTIPCLREIINQRSHYNIIKNCEIVLFFEVD